MTMAAPKATDVKKGISLLYETLQCPICLELMTAPVSTKCDHQFCKYCMMKLLDNSKQNRASCPVCKANITKRSLQESPGFQRLVVGLQDMIQAYEHDTRTNYFTGLFYPLKDKTQSEVDHKGSSGDTRDADLDNEKHTDHLPHSHSSTIAAQNGFARLMAFEDSTPFTENEGLDSGLGGAPPTSDKKMSSGADNPEPVKSDVPLVVEEATSAHEESFGTCPSLSSIPDETEHRLSRKSSRKKQKKKSKILQQRKKKSVEKVAEWLMNVPTDGSLELEEPERNGEDSDSGSSASTIDIKQHMTEMTHQKEDRAKALEDQVFGAVYKRRSNKFFPAPPNSLAEPSASTDTQASESVSIISNENFLLPDDVTRQEHEMGEATNGADSDFFKEAGQTEPRERTDASVEELNKSASAENKDKHDFVSPARTRKRTRSALQQVDSDLKEQESEVPDQKKPDRRKGRITKLDKSKPSRARKSLVLVEAQKGETCPNPRARSEEVQLQIESYPSSEDQDASAVRSTRRSRRLQVFAEEVQGGHRKSSLRATVPGKTSSVTKQSENPKSEALTDATPSRTGNKMEASKRNGCVYHQDLAEIESLSKPDEANKGTVGTASNAEPRSDVSPAHGVTVVPNSTSPNSADVVEPTLKSHTPANHPPNNPQLESSVRENDCEAESEEEQNDCEVDTEQLMKSFKATKRKSFHLGSVDVKKSCYTEKDGETDENRRDFAGENTQEALRDTGKSTSIDLISPSVSPVQIEKTVSEKPDCLTVEAFSPQSSGSGPGSSSARCRNSLSSALPPHQEPKSDMESPRLSFVPQIVDSGLHFTPVEHEDVNQTTKCPDVKESQPKRADTTELFTESSLTPDGLIPAAVQNVYDASGEVSSNSSILRNQRRKRKAPMLESPSGSDTDASKEDLPSLAQILGTTSCPPAGCQDPGEGNATEGECDAAAAADPLSDASACPSPDCVSPSQGSVDLFGTPEECDVPVNVEVSMESSQFSSEVLVTQQKIEMQQELARLEKMMALVSKVLQEKEGGPSEDVPSETHQCRTASDPEPQRFPRRSQDPGQASDRKDLPDAHQDAHPRPPGAEKVAEPAPSKPDDIPESVQHAGLSAKAAAVSKTLTSPSKTQKSGALSSDGQENKENNSPPRDDPKARLVLVSSGLASSQQTMVKKFAKRVGARVVSRVTPEVTHVVIGTDEQLVCERTLKYFLGIAGRKWVVSFQWISECFKQKKLLDESLFEVRGDTVNGPNHQGPSRARSTDDNHLLMKGYRICFQGSFTDMTTDEMEWMVELCGADVVKDPLLLEGKQKSHQLVIVQRRLEASPSRTHLSRNATVVTRGWLLDSVATYSLQDFANFGT